MDYLEKYEKGRGSGEQSEDATINTQNLLPEDQLVQTIQQSPFDTGRISGGEIHTLNYTT